MNPEVVNDHLQRRIKAAQAIIANPQDFIVCEQCRSLHRKTASHCHICGAYRWLTEPGDVQVAAMVDGSRPFPITSAVVPRL